MKKEFSIVLLLITNVYAGKAGKTTKQKKHLTIKELNNRHRQAVKNFRNFTDGPFAKDLQKALFSRNQEEISKAQILYNLEEQRLNAQIVHFYRLLHPELQ